MVIAVYYNDYYGVVRLFSQLVYQLVFLYVFSITQTADEKRISSSKLEILSNIYTLR